MKNITKIGLVAILTLTVAVPVFGWGPGGGRGGMMGNNYNQNTENQGQFTRGRMMGGNYNQNTENPGQFTQGGMMRGFDRNQGYNNQNSNLTEDQITRLNDLQKKFYDETAGLRDQMWAKSNELNTVLNSADPDADEVKALQTEINDLRAQMSNARIDYDLEAKKINPDGDSRGQMGRSGRMGGMGSFAPGVCF